MKNRKILVGIVITVIIAIVAFIKEREMINGYFSTMKLQFLLKFLNENYLYEVNEEQGEEGIYSGYLAALKNSDTYYLNKDELQVAKIKAEGNTFGIGLDLMWGLNENYLMVIGVEKNSPAARAGIRIGDCITKINGIQTIAANSEEITNQLYQVTPATIECELRRDEENKTVKLSFEKIELEEFTYETIDDVLYIDLHAIKTGTSNKLKLLLEQEKYKKIKGLILDLRNIATDQVDEVSKISDLFLNQGIAFKLQTKSNGMISYTTEEGAFDYNMVLITNKDTRGGVEALVLALEERAEILGGNTGGDRFIKKLITFEDGSGMSVASGSICDRYGNLLSDKGIEPDIRLYIDEKEKVLMLERGYIIKEEDSYLQEALKRLEES